MSLSIRVIRPAVVVAGMSCGSNGGNFGSRRQMKELSSAAGM